MLTPALASALQGLQLNQRRFAEHAHAISRSGDTSQPVDPTRDMAGILVSRRGYEANLAVAKRADEMLGSLIDILA